MPTVSDRGKCILDHRAGCTARRQLQCPARDTGFISLLERWAYTSGVARSADLERPLAKHRTRSVQYSASDLGADVALITKYDPTMLVLEYILYGKISKAICKALRIAHSEYKARYT